MSDQPSWLIRPRRDDDPAHLALLYSDEEWAALMADPDDEAATRAVLDAAEKRREEREASDHPIHSSSASTT